MVISTVANQRISSMIAISGFLAMEVNKSYRNVKSKRINLKMMTDQRRQAIMKALIMMSNSPKVTKDHY
jgi:hypothetical protein